MNTVNSKEESAANTVLNDPASRNQQGVGIAVWMERVTEEMERARQDFAPEAVHDLRVALRRCRSIADTFMTLDPQPAWEELKKEGKRLFRRLGDLRDVQVMMEWTKRLAADQDPAAGVLINYLSAQAARMRERAGESLESFNIKKWRTWQGNLARRTKQVPSEGLVFRHVALERWQEARELHRQALRNRSQIAFHRLRIGLKRFRYTAENFLPKLHELWGKDLKELQDVLGEFHDLHVLRRTAMRIGALSDPEVSSAWRARIEEESRKRLRNYRQKASGRQSVWQVWREGLPKDEDLTDAAEARMQAWAWFRDLDFAKTQHLLQLAMQLYDGMERERIILQADPIDTRSILRAAAVMHRIGFGLRGKKHRKATNRMIRNMRPPLGFPPANFRLAVLAARYHHGDFPRANHKDFVSLPEEAKHAVWLTSSILRLVNAIDSSRDRRIRKLEVRRSQEAIIIYADGYLEEDPIARKLAAARHPLEVFCRLPVLIRTQGELGPAGRNPLPTKFSEPG